MLKNLKLLSLFLVLAGFFTTSALAAGGPSGPATKPGVGKIGIVIMDPYKIAPLTAVIKNGGYTVTDAKVTVQGKGAAGLPISYSPDNGQIMLHGGIPVFGMYPDYLNTVNVEYKRNGESIKESYSIYAPPVSLFGPGTSQRTVLPTAKIITKAAPEIKKNMYLVNHLNRSMLDGAQSVWNLPAGGALEWDMESYVWMIDTNGDIRWYLNVAALRDVNNINKRGNFMGFYQTKDGNLLWGFGQRYVKFDLMGREIFNRALPKSYVDFSHDIRETHKGTYLMRVASADYKRADGKNVRTVRDVIIEVDPNSGEVLDEWKIFEILDPYRDVVLKVLDQGAVCLNVDASKLGQTMSKEELEDPNAPWGDVTGVGAGRNWAHINSAFLDPKDDGLVLSVRHQSAVVKVGRDKSVKWIIASPEGWNEKLIKKVLTPVDSKGKKIKCENSVCEGEFDWSWTQHTAYVTPKGTISVFDNGDSRGMEQPALPSMKYSRAVEYKVDEKNMTVEQIWQFGKERGFEWYSPITSVVEYMPKTDSMFIYSATAGLNDPDNKGKVYPFLHEIKYGTDKSLFEVKFDSDNIGYRALPIDIEKAFKSK